MKKRIFLIFWCLLLCVTVSFSWIITNKENIVKFVRVDYTGNNGTLVVAPKKIQMSVLMNDPTTNEMKVIGSSTDVKNPNNELFEVKNIVPNSNVPFKIRLKNKSSEVIQLKISLERFVCDERLLQEGNSKIYLSAVAGSNYANYPNVVAPENIYEPLSVAQKMENSEENEYYLTLYEMVRVPPTGQDGFVDIDCYFYFDKNMDNTYQDLDFSVLSFRAVE